MDTVPLEQWVVHIEVRLKPRVSTSFETLRGHIHEWLSTTFERITLPSTLEGWEDVPILASAVERVVACESICPTRSLSIAEIAFQIHVYQPSNAETFEEYTSAGGEGVGGTDDTAASTVWDLPNVALDGMWDSLIYGDNVKLKLLDYIQATFVLSDADVDFNLVSWNRVVLLHGPPGTGKTSLCKALAQKLAIRLSHRYSQARLLEINSHSLFSRWFSESGKLVQRLFSSITDLVDDEDAFVVVLIDEVESLTASRAGVLAGTEPSDGLRVVNALLTQLDKLKHRKNVLIMSTSNLMNAIDSAFIDRADIVQYIDLPPRDAIYDILRTCLMEMISKKVVQPLDVPSLRHARNYEVSEAFSAFTSSEPPLDPEGRSVYVSWRLLTLAAECQRLKISGRALRRLPVLALAKYIGAGSTMTNLTAPPPMKVVQQNSNGRPVVTNGIPRRMGSAADVVHWLDGIEKVLQDRNDPVTSGNTRACS